MSFGAYISDSGWQGPGAPFGEPFMQGLGSLAAYLADRQWQGPGAPFGLGQDPTIDGGGADSTILSGIDLSAIAGPPVGPNALGYGAGGSGSVAQFFQGVVNQSSAGTSPGGVALPTGQQAASAFSTIPTWVWVIGGVGVLMFFAGSGRRR